MTREGAPITLSEAEVAALAQALAAARFDEASITALFHIDSAADLPRVPPEAALARSSADRPLHRLVRLFVMGRPVPVEAARRALAPLGLEAAVRGRLLERHGPEVRATIAITPVDGLLVA